MKEAIKELINALAGLITFIGFYFFTAFWLVENIADLKTFEIVVVVGLHFLVQILFRIMTLIKNNQKTSD